MKKITAVIMFLAATLSAFDYKDLPAGRFVPWKQAEITFPDATWDTVDVISLGIHPGNNINEKISEKLLNALKSKGAAKRVYYFPEGDYTFEAPVLIGPNGYKANWDATGVEVNNFVLMGAGPEKTRFLFDCNVQYFKALLWIEMPKGYTARNNPRGVTVTPKTGEETITLQDASGISPGDFISVKSDNDPDRMFPVADTGSAWYKKYISGGYEDEFKESYGQIVRVVSVLPQNVVKITPPIGLDFKEELSPRASVFLEDNRRENIGFQDFYVEHIIDNSVYTPGGTNDIFDIAIRFAKDCYVKNVESYNTARGHVIIEYANNISVTDSKFSHARNYGVGGAGYGVCIQNRSSVVSVENNKFVHLRHAIVLKEGANHCVVAYNYSHDWAILDPAVGVSAEADFSIHGMYSHNNLFEGNLCHNIYYADYWGPTGPKTTSFRNRVFGADPLEGVYIDDFSHMSNVIANDIPGSSSLETDNTCDSLFIEGNIVSGTVEWNELATSSELPPSLYLESEPSYWIDILDWPAYGPDVPNSATNDIPASYDGPMALHPAKKKVLKRNIEFLQNGKRLHILGIPGGVINLKILTVNGKIVTSSIVKSDNKRTFIDLISNASGVYFAQLKCDNVTITKRFLIR